MTLFYTIYFLFCLGFGIMFAQDGKNVFIMILYFIMGFILCPVIIGGMIYEYLHQEIKE